MPASSTSTTSPGNSRNMRARSGTPAPARSLAADGPRVHSCRNLCRFSACTPSSRPSTSAEAADVASGTSRCPPARSAYSRARIAVVFPDPAGPIPASSSRESQANAVTSPRCPASSEARATASNPSSDAAADGPESPAAVGVRVALTSRASASRTPWLVYRPAPCSVNTDSPSARRSSAGSSSSAGASTDSDARGRRRAR